MRKERLPRKWKKASKRMYVRCWLSYRNDRNIDILVIILGKQTRRQQYITSCLFLLKQYYNMGIDGKVIPKYSKKLNMVCKMKIKYIIRNEKDEQLFRKIAKKTEKGSKKH